MGHGKDFILAGQVQEAALKCINFFQQLPHSKPDEALLSMKALNKALNIFPRCIDKQNHFQEAFDERASGIFQDCIASIDAMRKKRSNQLDIYNLLYHIFHACIVRMSPDLIREIATGIDPKIFQLSKSRRVGDLYEWCREIGFDEHQCHDIDIALNGHGRTGYDELIKNAIAREKRRQARIRLKNPAVIETNSGEEGEVVF